MNQFKTPEVAEVFSNYPEPIRQQLMFFRKLILDTATETESVDKIDETLKWGEPSYLTKSGSTIRMGWKKSTPRQYAMYFNCKTTLIETFKELYWDCLKFEGNRAIIFDEDDEIPVDELRHCIMLALTYHDRKHLQLLGI